MKISSPGRRMKRLCGSGEVAVPSSGRTRPLWPRRRSHRTFDPAERRLYVQGKLKLQSCILFKEPPFHHPHSAHT